MKTSTDVSRRIAIPLFAGFLLAFPSSVLAIPIAGGIGFGGAFTPTGGTGLGDATGINFLAAFVLDSSGDLDGIPLLTGATFTDFDFDPLTPDPVDPLWGVSFDGVDYSFTLADISVDFQSADALNLSGSGTLMATGFDDTAKSWTFSGNAAGEIVFTFSSITADTADVPEPTTLWLFGLGAVGLGLSRRRCPSSMQQLGQSISNSF